LIKNGTKIGVRYEVVRYIASGGMQDVYEAHDELTDYNVALKTPKAGQATDRFHKSAQMSARINHYNVAKTCDYFEINGSCYLIEELVTGTTVEDATLAIVPQIDPHLAAYLFLRLSKGLAASHVAGVAHRDLKPSNVLVDFSFKQVKITDFGIATITDSLFEDVIAKGDLTRSTSGTIKGALPYMAPEMMFRQKGDIVGAEADIWSLGAMLFRLITGAFPFGEGMMVPVNVQNKTRTAWPQFLTTNAQFASLSESLKTIIDACLVYEKEKRITAPDLVQRCEDLCFSFSERRMGTVDGIVGYRGFIKATDGSRIFYHSRSVYGPRSAKLGSKVIFSSFPGEPFPRAHPVLVCAA